LYIGQISPHYKPNFKQNAVCKNGAILVYISRVLGAFALCRFSKKPKSDLEFPEKIGKIGIFCKVLIFNALRAICKPFREN